MYISRLEVHNYKSYHHAGPMDFKPGFNIFTGQNNAGKTALLEAMSLTFPANPHRSLKTLPTRGAQLDTVSSVDISFSLSRDELLQVLRQPGAIYHIPLPQVGEFGWIDPDPQARFLETLLREVDKDRKEGYVFRACLQKQPGEAWMAPECPPFGLYPPRGGAPQGQRHFLRIQFDNGRFRPINSVMTNEQADIAVAIASALRGRIYRFMAEWLNVASGPFGPNAGLLPDARNLPEVLISLQGRNPPRFQQLNELLHEIFPQVQAVSVRPAGGNDVEIIVWTIDPKLQRDDLAVSLKESGTGIGQVLAILYILLTSDFPQTIMIDEPQSFLHPGAVRKLVDVMKTHPQHQYIVATHSPTVIAATNPATITMITLRDGASAMQAVETADTKGLRVCLAEVGARLADVFGADSILWVEGDTEEICFPKILEKIGQRTLMGTAIVGVKQTGDLEGRDAERVLEIYERLTGSNSLLPPAIGFIFDSECKTEQKKHELNSRGNGRTRFLPRRMYENYLLNPLAIATLANSISNFSPQPVTEEQVGRLTEAKLQDQRYFCQSDRAGEIEHPTFRVDAAKVLKDLFNELSETRVEYRKVEYAVALTDWIIEKAPGDLREISDLLVDTLTAAPHQTPKLGGA